ncbi:MAG: hypothetical protein IJS32_04825, partial [Kiritimatiellae bacterium]|nr:hypothetical protein [Kiritimatiellia bacterium]
MNRPHLFRIPLLLLATAVAAASAPAALLVRIPSGTERTVGSGVVTEADSSSPEVVTASPSPAGGITLHAGEPGRAEVTSRRADGSVRVTQVLVLPALSESALAVYSLVGDIPGVEVYDAAGKIVIDGKVASASEKSRVDALVAAFGNGVLNLSVLDTGKSNEAIADFILRSSGCDTLSVSILGDTAYLRGTVPSDAARSNVLALASTQIAKIVDMTEVREDMIETEVLFLRVQKTSGWNFGMNLLDGGDGLALQGSFNGSQAYADRHWGGLQMGVGWTATLAPRINAILSDGGGEVVARPRVGTRIGERGRFLSGGEMYYKTAGEVSGDLKSVEYGIELSVAPRYLSGDRLCNDISIELSFPNQQASSADLSLDKYTIESSVVCELGQSVILSGLTERIRNSATDKTPVLGDIPVVNLFFSARSKELTESELIAVITPRLLDGDLNERRQAEHGQDIQDQREWLARNDAEALRVSMRAHAAAASACAKERAAYDKLKALLARQEAEERAQAEKERAKAEKIAAKERAKAEALAEKERRKAEKAAAEKAAAEAKAEAKVRKAAEEAAAREAKAREKAERIAAEKRAEEERIAAKERAKAEALAEAKARKAAEEAAAREAKAREKAERIAA